MAPSGHRRRRGVGQPREEEEEEENPAPSRTFQDVAIDQRKIRDAPEEMQLLGSDVVPSMWIWGTCGAALGKAQQLPRHGRALLPPFCSTEPENSVLFLGRNQEILLLELPFG